MQKNERLEKENSKQKIILNIDDPQLFWRTLKESRTVAPVQNNIYAFDWYSQNQDMKIDYTFLKNCRVF